MLKRAALFTGGGAAGFAVSALASYGLVNALFPNLDLKAVGAAEELAMIRPAPRPDLPPAYTPHAAPITPVAAVAVAPLAELIPASAPTDAALAVQPAILRSAEPDQAPLAATPGDEPETAPGANPAPVVVMGRPEITPPARPAYSADLPAEEIASALPERALSAPPSRPDATFLADADAFAALAAEDAALRPETAAFAAAARPDEEAEEIVVAVATQLIASDAIPAIRPQPRPDRPAPAELLRVASPAPVAEAPAEEVITPRAASGRTCGTRLARAMPRRRSGAESGSDFFASLVSVSGSERDSRVINELARGNMPDFLRHLEPVTFRGTDARGKPAEITICVTPDYLALGSDRDFVRTPLGLPAAAHIAGLFDMTLPTPRMVDAIYAQADVHLKPAPMQAGPQMSSTAYLLRHNATIQSQLQGRGGLIAGQKKDVVMASRMASHPGRVAIYGWHRSGGNPIQPVSTVHGANYADYSHGIRLVSKTAYLNGKPVALDDLLASSRYAWLINSDGPMPAPVIRIASR